MYPQFPWFLFLLYGVRALNLEQVCIWSSILMHFMVLPKAARWPICSISGRYAACTICSIAVLSADPHFRFAYKVFRKLHQTYHDCEEDAIFIVDQANTTWPYHAPIISLDITPWNLLWYSVEKWLQIGCYIFSKRYNEDLSTNQKYPFNSSPARSTGPPTNQPTNGHGNTCVSKNVLGLVLFIFLVSSDTASCTAPHFRRLMISGCRIARKMISCSILARNCGRCVESSQLK